ncbi:MAG TPA: hypothetical protein VJ981_06310, partial [Gammaproteobacteria bacterium]|nr:hypothetical protein [Gammaproteobacteria bacterium]
MKTLFSIVGLLFGAMIDEGAGAVFGFFIGLLSGALVQARDRILAVERQLAAITSEQQEDETASVSAPPA